MNRDVLLVLINYTRPHNMSTVLKAWREQTVKPKMTVVVDNSPMKTGNQLKIREPYPSPALDDADDVWRISKNIGCACRFAPALMLYQHRYVLFADDDYLPGKRAVENLLKTAEHLGDKFASIGQVGRNFFGETPYYRYRSVPKDNKPVQCDMVYRSQFFRQDLVHHALAFRSKLVGKVNVDIHDDLLLNLGIQMGTGYQTYVTAREQSDEEKVIATDLDQTGALCSRPEHLKERNLFVEAARDVGWKRPEVTT